MANGKGGAPVGNRNAASGHRWKDAINQALKARGQGALVEVANALVQKAIEGDLMAIKEIGDRLDGKASQSVEVSGQISLTDAFVSALREVAQRSVNPVIEATPVVTDNNLQ